ncbi:MAG: hypothetical protein II786_03410 [Muribaculaceae bacterium]|nr:hypothetical protein [Muribaculaceae bacterium]
MVNLELNEYAKRTMDLPSHAYHPNASLRNEKRKGYVAWPAKHEPETNA